MRSLIIGILFSCLSPIAFSAPQTIVNRPLGTFKGLVVIAPAKKYLMQERLFENLARSLSKQGFAVVRFNWDVQTLSDPSLEIQRAAHDLKYVVSESQRYFKVGRQNTVIISKSFSSKALMEVLGLAKAQILLTPNCSVEAPFSSIYGKIIENRKIKTSIYISNEDPNCDVRQIHQFLIQSSNPPSIYLTHGDHNFVTPTTLNSRFPFIRIL